VKVPSGGIHKVRIAFDIVFATSLIFRAAKAVNQVVGSGELSQRQAGCYCKLKVEVLAEHIITDHQPFNLAVFYADSAAPPYPAVIHQGIVAQCDVAHRVRR